VGQFWMEITALSGSDFDGIQHSCGGVGRRRLSDLAAMKARVNRHDSDVSHAKRSPPK
jgi:hypothetical protein